MNIFIKGISWLQKSEYSADAKYVIIDKTTCDRTFVAGQVGVNVSISESSKNHDYCME